MSSNKIQYLKDYTPLDYLVDNIYLTIHIYANTQVKVTSVVTYCKNIATNTCKLILNGSAKLNSLKLNEHILETKDYQHNLADETLQLNIALPDKFTLTIETELDPSTNRSGMGLYQSGDNLLTQCEAEGFRKITFYPDRPDVLAIWTTEIITPTDQYSTVLSNGNLIKSEPTTSSEMRHVWHDPFRKPSYLFAVVIGNLAKITDSYTTKSQRLVKLEIYTSNADIDKCDFALKSLKRAFAWDEQRFNLEYDLDLYMIVATNDFNMGAMENKGLNIFNSKYVLANPETATDNDFLNIEAVIGHEYFHNWTGNRVTCRDWFQLSLKEGLTVFRENEFSADLHNRGVQRINTVKNLRATQFNVDASALAHSVRPESYIQINNFYTSTIYEKGSEVVKMYQTILGKTKFATGIQNYLKKHDGSAATCEDFFQAMQEITELDLSGFMLWYSQAGTPSIDLNFDYDQSQKILKLDFKQSLAHNTSDIVYKPMLIPVCIGLIHPSGEPMLNAIPVQGRYTTTEAGLVLLLDSDTNIFVFKDVVDKPHLSLLRDFSAPVNLNYNYSLDELLFLSNYDTDEFNKYEALNRLFSHSIKQIYTNLTKQISDYYLDSNLIQCLRGILGNNNLSPEFKATLLQLPTKIELLPQIGNVKLDLLDKAFTILISAISQELLDGFMEIYELNLTSVYKYEDHGRRSLKNLSLFYIIKALEANYFKKANGGELANENTLQLIETISLGQYNNATNMTDELAVLSAINHVAIGNIRSDIFDSFYKKWWHNELVMDKYLSLHASSNLITTQQLNTLMLNKVFIATNPNKIYALLGSFTNNLLRFHCEEGYNFIVDNIIAIDKFNPQVASRLANGFSSCNYLDQNYKVLAKNSLNKILSNSPSSDVYELVSKMVVSL